MIKRLLILLFLSISFLTLHSQRKGLIGNKSSSEGSLFIGTGPAYLFSDIGKLMDKSNNNRINWDDMQPTFMIGFRQLFLQHRLGYKVAFQYNIFSGSDIKSINRDLSYKSDIFHFLFQGELAVLKIRNLPQAGYSRLYLLAGIGANYGNANLMDNLPGTTIKSNTTSFELPIGAGFDVYLSGRIKIGAELFWSYFLDDYIDGFSPRSSGANDVSANLIFSLSYVVFENNRRRIPGCDCW